MRTTVIVAMLIVLLTACANPSEVKEGQTNTPATPKQLNISWNKDIGDLNPHTYTPNQFFAQAMVYDGLVQYGSGGKIQPMLAESWNVSDQGKTLTFSLRKDVKFSDGTPFTAKNAKRNFDSVLKNKKAHAWMEVMNQIRIVEAPDDHTLVIRLNTVYEPALQELTYIRPVRFLGDAAFPADDDTSKSFVKPIGTGPWVLKEYQKDQRAVFVRNPYYWGKRSIYDEIIISIIPDAQVRALALKNGEIDLIYGIGLVPLDVFKQFSVERTYRTATSAPLATRVMVLNTSRGPTADRIVRQALQHSFDKQSVIDSLFHGVEPRADQLMSPDIPFVDPTVTASYAYDVNQAGSLLQKAGWIMNEKTNIREKDGKPLQVTLRYIRSDAVQSQLAQYVQMNWKTVGVDVVLQGDEEQQFWERTFQGDFDIVFDETWGAPYDPHSYLSAMRKDEHSSSSFQAQRGLPERAQLHQWIDESLTTQDVPRRKELIRNVLRMLDQEALYIPISYQVNIAIYDEKRLPSFDFASTHYEFPWDKWAQ